MGIGGVIGKIGLEAFTLTTMLLMLPQWFVLCTLAFSWLIRSSDNNPIGPKKGAEVSLFFIDPAIILNMLLIPALTPILTGFLELS